MIYVIIIVTLLSLALYVQRAIKYADKEFLFRIRMAAILRAEDSVKFFRK